MILILYEHGIRITSQLDHCKDEGMWSGMSVFVSLGDSKVGVPAENTSRAFFEVIDKTTKHSHKKRCSMDEVSLLLSVVEM